VAGDLLIVAGEPSGDVLGGPLARELLKLRPGTRLWGYGGENMASAGVEIITGIEKLAVMGFVEVAGSVPAMFKRLKTLVEETAERKTDGAILIDYPGFNLRLAKELSKRGIPVVYYVSPQLWAWKPRRIEKIKGSVKKMLVILPFEEEIYRNAGVPVTFVGHPFVESVVPSCRREDFLLEHGLSEPLLLLLPGSREQEVRRLLGPMLGAFDILKEEIGNLSGLIIRSANLPETNYKRAANRNIEVITGEITDALFASTAALCCSGSATLQCAVAGLPHVITYKANVLSAAIYKRFIRTEFIGLSNLVAGDVISPEILQKDATAENLAAFVKPWLIDIDARERKKQQLARVRDKLGPVGATERAAKEAIKAIYS